MQLLFRLTDTPNVGVSCGGGGVFVGGVALLEQVNIAEHAAAWRPVACSI